FCLTTFWIPPNLSDDDSAGSQFDSVPPGDLQSRNHRSVTTIYRHEGARVEHEGAHERLLLLRPSSDSARLSSFTVSGPCSFSQVSRNSANASDRSFASAAPANHDETPTPAFIAAARTSSLSSASREMLILSTFISVILSHPVIPGYD